MAYVTTYRLTAKNFEGQDITIHISDTTSAEGTPVFTDLLMTFCEAVIESPAQSKHAIIKGTRLTCAFVVEETVGLSTFIGGEDEQFLVEAYIGPAVGAPAFTGYLVTDATREAFLQYRGTDGVERGVYSVVLTATDNLAVLKEVPLTKTDGTNPRGYFKPIEYLAWALQKTNLQLAINIVDGISDGDTANPVASGNWYNTTYIWSKSFEQDINVSINCYEVIEQILKGRYIVQHQSAWWIVRPDEINGTDYTVFSYDFAGNYGTATTQEHYKAVDKAGAIKFITRDGEVSPERPYHHAQLTYKYNYPIEIIDNIDFDRVGSLIPVVVDMFYHIKTYANSGAFPATGEFEWIYKATDTGNHYKWNGTGYTLLTAPEIPSGTAYVHLDWTTVRFGGGSPTVTTYTAKIVQAGVERSVYAVIPSNANFHGIQSNRVPMHMNDKFVLSVDRRIIANPTGGGTVSEDLVWVRLYGDDGTYWNVVNHSGTGEAPGQWVQSNSTFTINQKFCRVYYNRDQTDEREWMSVSVDTRPLPVSGEIEVILLQSTLHGAVETHFTNLQLEYVPLIKGSYAKFTGQYHKVSQDLNLKANLEDDVYISDSPKKLFKGALHRLVGTKYLLAERFYNYNAGTGGQLEITQFGKYQAFEYWNQHFKEFRIVQDTLLGMDSVTNPNNPPSLIHTWEFNYTDEHSSLKTWMLLSYKMDLLSCKWSGVFAEVYDTGYPKNWLWDHLFEYAHDN